MTEAGLKKVAEAHQNGQWDAAIRIEQTDVIPTDLEKVLRRRKGALAGYRRLTHSRKRQILRWPLASKSQVTRQRRVEAVVQEVAE
ncbi:MAG: YdeI/OmpD-associated family protein [Blastocatellia bacterium]